MELTQNCQKLFDYINYHPENLYDASNYLRSYFGLEKDRAINVSFAMPVLYDGKYINNIEISKNNFLDAFYPKVWKQLIFGQKLLAICHAFQYIVNSDTQLKQHKPNIIFNAQADDVELGAMMENNGKNEFHISVDYLMKKSSNSITILNTIAHELYHAKQVLQTTGKTNLDDYNKELKSSFSGNVWADLNYAIESKELQEDLLFSLNNVENPIKDLKYFDYWLQIKDDVEWREIMYLAYINCAKETGAFDKAEKFSSSALRYFEKNFEKIPEKYLQIDIYNTNQSNKDSIEVLNSYGYNLKPEDIKVFREINFNCISEAKECDNQTSFNIPINTFFTSKVWQGLKTMLDIHKNKCVKNNTLEQKQEM